MSNFICKKCKTCGKFPFCKVLESKDGDCGEYIKRDIYTHEIKYKEIKNNENKIRWRMLWKK